MIDDKIIMRFSDKVALGNSNECWEWTGAKRPNGYGSIKVNRRNVLPHRLSYQIFKGEIPDGMVVMHSCDNGFCCNPFHLSIGTQSENMKDAVSRNRVPMLRTAPWNSRFTRDDVRVMTEMKNSGLSFREVAKKFSTSHTIVRGWVCGRKKMLKDSVITNASLARKPTE